MITILSKLFIKPNLSEIKTRNAYGMLCGIVGIVLNAILSATKIIVGAISGSIAIVADGFNNLSDAGASIVTLFGFVMSDRTPDKDHPFGHGRMEYVAGFVVAMLIFATAVTLIKDSIMKIIHPQSTLFSTAVVATLSISIIVKLYMAYYNYQISRKVNSLTIRATCMDSLMDTVATSMVLTALVIEHFTAFKVDGYMGVGIGLFILFSGVSIAKSTINPLLGQPPEKEFVDEIERITLGFDEKIIGLHDLMVHDYGPGRRFISLHAEVPADENVVALHEIIDALEKELIYRLKCSATVHLDPVDINDENTNRLKSVVCQIIKDINAEYSIHDFRVVSGKQNTNLIFDVLLPMSDSTSDGEICSIISNKVCEKMGRGYSCVIQVDRNIGTI